MRILIGCETSGTLRRAFAALGHEVWSCDLLPADDGERQMHLQCDVRIAVRLLQWDLFVVHPTCTYLSSSGLHWNKRRPERAVLTEEAVAFAVDIFDQPQIPRVVMENPIGCLSTRFRKPDQIVQPWQFGDDASKATCLWLKGVEPLPIDPAAACAPRYVCQDCHFTMHGYSGACSHCAGVRVRERWANQTDSGQNKLAPSADRWKLRSETYPGLAHVAARTWGRT